MGAVVKKVEVVEMNGREVTSDGRFHANLLADYIIKKHLDTKKRNKWTTLREAALFIYHSGTLSNQEDIRIRLSKLASELKARGFCLVVEPATKQFKIYEGTEIEKQYVLDKQGYWQARAQKGQEWSNYLSESVSTESEHETPVQAN